MEKKPNLTGTIVGYNGKDNTVIIRLMFIPKSLPLNQDVTINELKEQ